MVTRWADAASFDAWMATQANGSGHGQSGAPGGEGAPRPVSSGAELLSFDVVDLG